MSTLGERLAGFGPGPIVGGLVGLLLFGAVCVQSVRQSSQIGGLEADVASLQGQLTELRRAQGLAAVGSLALGAPPDAGEARRGHGKSRHGGKKGHGKGKPGAKHGGQGVTDAAVDRQGGRARKAKAPADGAADDAAGLDDPTAP